MGEADDVREGSTPDAVAVRAYRRTLLVAGIGVPLNLLAGFCVSAMPLLALAGLVGVAGCAVAIVVIDHRLVKSGRPSLWRGGRIYDPRE